MSDQITYPGDSTRWPSPIWFRQQARLKYRELWVDDTALVEPAEGLTGAYVTALNFDCVTGEYLPTRVFVPLPKDSPE